MNNSPLTIAVIDNGGQWTHRIWRVVRDMGYESILLENTTPVEQIKADAMILSGGAARIAWKSPKLGHCMDYLDSFGGPILGHCIGHQLMAIHSGGTAGPAETPEYGLARLEVLEEDVLFRGLPKEFTVWQSHNDEVKKAPNFTILAKSESCAIQAMKHNSKPFYGVQFHPEVNDTQHGDQIIQNFIEFTKQ